MSRCCRLCFSARRGRSPHAGLPALPWAATDIAQSESARTRVCSLKSVFANFSRTSSDEAMNRP